MQVVRSGAALTTCCKTFGKCRTINLSICCSWGKGFVVVISAGSGRDAAPFKQSTSSRALHTNTNTSIGTCTYNVSTATLCFFPCSSGRVPAVVLSSPIFHVFSDIADEIFARCPSSPARPWLHGQHDGEAHFCFSDCARDARVFVHAEYLWRVEAGLSKGRNIGHDNGDTPKSMNSADMECVVGCWYKLKH